MVDFYVPRPAARTRFDGLNYDMATEAVAVLDPFSNARIQIGSPSKLSLSRTAACSRILEQYDHHVFGRVQRNQALPVNASINGASVTNCAKASGALHYYERTVGNEG